MEKQAAVIFWAGNDNIIIVGPLARLLCGIIITPPSQQCCCCSLLINNNNKLLLLLHTQIIVHE